MKRISHIVEDGVEKKRCSCCHEYKPLDNYKPKKDRWDGLHNECIVCQKTRNKRRANPEYVYEEDEDNFR